MPAAWVARPSKPTQLAPNSSWSGSENQVRVFGLAEGSQVCGKNFPTAWQLCLNLADAQTAASTESDKADTPRRLRRTRAPARGTLNFGNFCAQPVRGRWPFGHAGGMIACGHSSTGVATDRHRLPEPANPCPSCPLPERANPIWARLFAARNGRALAPVPVEDPALAARFPRQAIEKIVHLPPPLASDTVALRRTRGGALWTSSAFSSLSTA